MNSDEWIEEMQAATAGPAWTGPKTVIDSPLPPGFPWREAILEVLFQVSPKSDFARRTREQGWAASTSLDASTSSLSSNLVHVLRLTSQPSQIDKLSTNWDGWLLHAGESTALLLFTDRGRVLLDRVKPEDGALHLFILEPGPDGSDLCLIMREADDRSGFICLLCFHFRSLAAYGIVGSRWAVFEPSSWAETRFRDHAPDEPFSFSAVRNDPHHLLLKDLAPTACRAPFTIISRILNPDSGYVDINNTSSPLQSVAYGHIWSLFQGLLNQDKGMTPTFADVFSKLLHSEEFTHYRAHFSAKNEFIELSIGTDELWAFHEHEFIQAGRETLSDAWNKFMVTWRVSVLEDLLRGDPLYQAMKELGNIEDYEAQLRARSPSWQDKITFPFISRQRQAVEDLGLDGTVWRVTIL